MCSIASRPHLAPTVSEGRGAGSPDSGAKSPLPGSWLKEAASSHGQASKPTSFLQLQG